MKILRALGLIAASMLLALSLSAPASAALLHEFIDTSTDTVIDPNQPLLYELGRALRERGLFVVTVDYPSVPEDALWFRASVSAALTRRDLDDALIIFEDVVARRLRGERRTASPAALLEAGHGA